MYFVFLCFYKNEINITNKKKKKIYLSFKFYIMVLHIIWNRVNQIPSCYYMEQTAK